MTQTLQGALQAAIRSALGCANDFNGDLHAMCDVYGIPDAPISGRLIPAANRFDASITDASSALNYFLQNPQNACGTLALDFTRTSTLDPRITFSRGSQATLFDSTGALVYAKHNLALQSQTFQTTWAVTRSSINADAAISPDGTLTADKLIEDTSLGTHIVTQSISLGGTADNTTYTVSVFAKAAERTRFELFDNAQASSGITAFDLSTGTVISGTGAITPIGDGWYRCVISPAKSTSASSTFTIRLISTGVTTSYTGDGTSGIFIWGAQLNLPNMEGGVTSSLSTYYPTVASAYYAPRFDYNPSTLAAQGLLIEEQRTNSIRNNTMQGAVAGTPGTDPTNWVVSGAGGAITSKTIVGFGTDGGIAYVDIRFVFNAGGTATIRPEQTTQIAASSGQTWTGSSYVKLAGGSLANCTVNKIVQYRAAGVGVTNQIVAFVPTTAELRIQRETISFAATDPTTTTVNFDIQVVTSGAADITLRIGLPQLEQGAFATSVIPTTTTALTRNADAASMTGTNFSSWYNQSEGSFVANGVSFGGAVAGLYSASNGTSTQSVSVRLQQQFTFAQGLNRASFTYTNNSSARHGFAYKANDYGAAYNGNALSISAQPTDVPTTANVLNIGALETGAFSLNGWIRRISYYPVRLPNSTLQALTA